MAIRNIEDVINKCQKSLDMLERMFPARGSNSTVTAKVREMLQDPETVQTLMIQKPGRYFLAYGWELEPGTMRKQEMSLPTPLGGAPLPAVLSIELESFQADDEQYLVTWHQELDKEGDERVLQQAFKRFSAGGSSPPDLPKFDVDDRAEFRINRKTGWIEHATVVRSVKANEGSQIETFEFRAVADGH